MKKLLALLAFLVIGQTQAQTFTVNNLVVNGTFSAAGKVHLADLQSQVANSVVANVTGSAASPTAFVMPSCSTTSSALQYTSGTGFTCNTSINAATLSGSAVGTNGSTVPLLSGANTWSGAQAFTSTITPSQTAGIVGTTTNNNANAGSVGEYQSATATTGTLVSGTVTNVTSLSLTAGDWDVTGICAFNPSGASITVMQCGISTTSGALGAFGTYLTFFQPTTAGWGIPAPIVRLSLASTTTVYLVTQLGYSGGTPTSTGFLRVRRTR